MSVMYTISEEQLEELRMTIGRNIGEEEDPFDFEENGSQMSFRDIDKLVNIAMNTLVGFLRHNEAEERGTQRSKKNK